MQFTSQNTKSSAAFTPLRAQSPRSRRRAESIGFGFEHEDDETSSTMPQLNTDEISLLTSPTPQMRRVVSMAPARHRAKALTRTHSDVQRNRMVDIAPEELHHLQTSFAEREEELAQAMDMGRELVDRIKVLTEVKTHTEEDIASHLMEIEAIHEMYRVKKKRLEAELHGTQYYEWAFESLQDEMNDVTAIMVTLENNRTHEAVENEKAEATHEVETRDRKNAELREKLAVWVLPKFSPMRLAFTLWTIWAHPRVMQRMRNMTDDHHEGLIRMEKEEAKMKALAIKVEKVCHEKTESTTVLIRRLKIDVSTFSSKKPEHETVPDTNDVSTKIISTLDKFQEYEQKFHMCVVSYEASLHALRLKSSLNNVCDIGMANWMLSAVADALFDLAAAKHKYEYDAAVRAMDSRSLEVTVADQRGETEALIALLHDMEAEAAAAEGELERSKASHDATLGDIERLLEELAAAEALSDDLNEKVRVGREVADENAAASDALETDNARRRAAASDMAASLKDVGPASVLAATLEGLRGSLAATTLAVSEKAAAMSDLTRDVAELSGDIQDLEAENARLGGINDGSREAEAVLALERSALSTEHGKVSADLEALRANIVATASELEASRGRAAGRTVECKSLEGPMADLAASNAALEAATVEKEVAGAAQRQVMAGLGVDVLALEGETRAVVRRLAWLGTEDARLSCDLDGIAALVETQTTAGVAIQEQVAALERSLGEGAVWSRDRTAELDTVRAARAVLDADYAALALASDAVRRDRDATSLKVEATAARVRALAEKANGFSHQQDVVESGRAAAAAQSGAVVAKMTDHVARIQKVLAVTVAALGTSQERLDVSRSEGLALQTASAESHAALESAIAEGQRDVAAARAENAAASQRERASHAGVEALLFEAQHLRDELADLREGRGDRGAPFEALEREYAEAREAREGRVAAARRELVEATRDAERQRGHAEAMRQVRRAQLIGVQREGNASAAASRALEAQLAALADTDGQQVVVAGDIAVLRVATGVLEGELARAEHDAVVSDRWVRTLSLEAETLHGAVAAAKVSLAKAHDELRRAEETAAALWEVAERAERQSHREAALQAEHMRREEAERDTLRSEVAALSEEGARMTDGIAALVYAVEAIQRETVAEHTRHGEDVRAMYRDHDQRVAAVRGEHEAVEGLRADVRRAADDVNSGRT